MKFFIDAQLPPSLVKYLQDLKIEVWHTGDLPKKERTPDSEISAFCNERNLILITKDSDFLDSYLLRNEPKKLLSVTTGNIRNKDLILLFDQLMNTILIEFENNHWLELSNGGLIVH
ncbi:MULTISPECIES: DUF5615 family PIN-like protein [Leptospira]|uniref:Toxin-antitoxin system, toxin component, PIN family n=3 Tax=Leptospira santarosai TaxID=28183 RepID=A0A0E2BPV4_9LEPT|nr:MULTISPECIES: DUF5615 family PIN-like protein [Leptospira]EMO58094.1 toxin-antitoxin system, toxin component, PIN family [Leptospira santarosai str. CBC1416]EKO33412.1 toxin-antitoxin system, toxin component, PIN family [Leptospira santarosai str. MOR084]EKO79744.1 toxin-antitoxin system, toxin component, PIN family [Leptospira sp. Fiocruz LV3954]EKR92263.1 putative toxin-antitoxin system, toxin component, PIN family [Leptospira santarosai str. CBC379]EMI68755.1 putative toxin-antitoxin sys